ncbi:glycosyltransferase family A protein [Streptomyces sp. WMMC500]|uniref:glycosyltransferase family 2 protein n=1 Tax=Streptomyces sp. WMMC500 TaxID=3015154 RepID=UPI00248AA5B0|nr:glycosyltransferase family A protein [Streptomyces sp. WMMC500]WBB62957.1 glycosyltransferase family A protein [Streptomyces sp. WMMC500]
MEQPHVSVVIAAYNAMPYLTRCVESVLAQSLPPDAVEVVAVDDGSTDGTGAELDRFARLHPGRVRVVHQESSGGPAAPRNAGIELARGRYVFFLDADDYLGPEALARMTAMADENGSDVVVGKLVGVGGRKPPTSMFRRDQPDADLYASRVFWVLNPMKLFRRELIERHGLRFPTDLRTGEDQIFVTRAYLHAAKISVLASYDCVYYVLRDDGGNLTTTVRKAPRPAGGTAGPLAAMFALVCEHTPAGPRRDHLLTRLFGVNLQRALRGVRREPDPERSRRMFAALHEPVARWYSETAVAKLPAIVRLQGELVRRGLYEEAVAVVRYIARRRDALDREGGARPVRWLAPADFTVEGGRVYAHYPYFRDPRLGLPDAVFDVTRQVGARSFVRPATVTVAQDRRDSRVLSVRGRRRARLPAVALELTATRESDGRTVTVAVPPPAGGQVNGRASGTGTGGSRAFTARIRVPQPGIWHLALRIAGNSRSELAVQAVRVESTNPARALLGWLARGGGEAVRPAS